jgi:hypothetical protein
MVWPPQSARIITPIRLGVIAWCGWRTGAVVDRALDEGSGFGWRHSLDPEIAARLRRRSRSP